MPTETYGPVQQSGGAFSGALDFFQWVGDGVKDVLIAKSNAEAAAENRKDAEQKTQQIALLERIGYSAQQTIESVPSWVLPAVGIGVAALLAWKFVK